MKQYTYIANWKMNSDYDASIHYAQQLAPLLKQTTHRVILCPSFLVIAQAHQLLKSSQAHVGAQTCSPFQKGSYTGQVDAQSLKQAGCSFCLVGHSERRLYCHETIEDTVHQTTHLLQSNVTPIVCVGETAEQRAAQQTLSILEKLITPILGVYKMHQADELIIAYEPVWAIGTGVIPSLDQLNEALSLIRNLTEGISGKTTVLYGGSIDDTNANLCLKSSLLDGLLIGNASLDFQKFKNIVSLNC